MATRENPRQHWRYWTAEQLADRYKVIAREESADTGNLYALCLYDLAVQLDQECEEVNIRIQRSIAEACCSAAFMARASELEVRIDLDDIIGYASQQTQRRYRDDIQLASKLRMVYTALAQEYNKLREQLCSML
ncbi:hypothetical protein COV16_04910 [Candidatus Woesearchaeota archaeon CG10_big_fil_rev_8_21_14_0_10_34_8]|nr:MAG: hypothetical protein COV16_04910 [Candidatus Woesearchaeota archaeon CG10_big_fil_rev_8_21_14_0_10_34_8]